jgi:hypothetical protein
MKLIHVILLGLVLFFAISCADQTFDEKGIKVSTNNESVKTNINDGLHHDSLSVATRPSSVLLTGINNIRLTPIYKVNVNKDDQKSYIGHHKFHYHYKEIESNKGNNWGHRLMPGLEAVFGYNMVNVSLYDVVSNQRKELFDRLVLIKTMYYPSFTKDTLSYKTVEREFIIVTVFDEDTNKDGYINAKDLRRIYLFNTQGDKMKALVPMNYSVFKSEYDSGNDFMYVYAKPDLNNNGRKDEVEPIHIFWIDLKDPQKSGQLY